MTNKLTGELDIEAIRERCEFLLTTKSAWDRDYVEMVIEDVPKLIEALGVAEMKKNVWVSKYTDACEQNKRLQEQIEQLRQERDEWKNKYEVANDNGAVFAEIADEHKKERDELKKENERLREALGFYADKKTYQLGVRFSMGTAHPSHEPIEYDKGEKARKALEASE